METDLGRVLDALPAMVWAARPDGDLDFANRRWSAFVGHRSRAADRLQWRDLVETRDLPTLLEHWRSILSSDEPGELRARIRRFDGRYRWVVFQCSPVRDDSGRVTRWYGVGAEDHAEPDEAHRRPELDFKSIVDSLPIPTAVTTASGEVEALNPLILDYFGRTPDELKDWKNSDVVHRDDLERTIDGQQHALKEGVPYNIERRHRRADGVYRWHKVLGVPLRNQQEEILRWLHLLIDTDDLKRAEEALQSTRNNLGLIISTIPVMAWTARPDGSADFFNQQYLNYVGLSFGEPRDWDWTASISEYWDLTAAVHPDDVTRLAATWQAILASGQSGEAEARLRRYDGAYRWFLFRANPLRDERGTITKWYGVSIDIDERKQAEEALLASEREARLIVDCIPGGIEVLSPTGKIEAVNQHVARYFGKPAEELKSTGLTRQIHPQDLQSVSDTALRATTTGHPYDAELRFLRADGEYRWFQVRGLPFRDADGDILRWYALHTDIDDRKRAEEALRESERNFKLTIDTIPALAWSAYPEGPAEFCSQHYLDFVGLSAEQAQGWGWTAAVHPDDLGALSETWQAIIASGKPGEAEARLRRFDGEYRWMLFRASPLHDASGRIVKWYGVNTDIDDRKRAETNLAREKHVLEMIASGSPLRDVLGALCKMVEAAGPGCYCDVHPIDLRGPIIEYSVAPSLPASYTEPIAGLSLSGGLLPCSIAVRQRAQVVAHDMDTDPRWREAFSRTHVLDHGLRSVWSTPIFAKDGRILGTLCLYQRRPASPTAQHQSLISHATYLASIAIERSRTEAALRRSETLLAEAQQLSSTGSFSWRVDTDEVGFSQELCRIFEFAPETAVTLDQVRARVHPEDVSLLSEQMERVRAGYDYLGYEIRLRMPDGRIKYLRTFGRVVRHHDQQLECLAAVQDITERRLADEALSKARSELAHVSRVSSFGALTASIAHEVNQPLAGIITNASTCLRMLAANPPDIEVARETARRTIRDGNRAADVIARLRTLFGNKAGSIEPIDLNDAAREVIALASGDLQRSGVTLRTELADTLPLAGGDRVQLQQVIMNLLRNGVDAMSGIIDRPRSLVIRTGADADGQVCLTVQDAGVGFGPEGTERLFEAFYTTKSDGMGMGLFVSRSIIERHNGRLWGQANDGPGVRFSFSIPRYSVAVDHLGAGIPETPAAGSAQGSAAST